MTARLRVGYHRHYGYYGSCIDNEKGFFTAAGPESLIVTLDSTSTDQLNLDYVIDRLLNEESRQGTKPNTELWASTVAYVADKKPRVPLEKITCYRCGRKGHYKANCPEPEREQNAKEEKAHLAYDDDSFLF